MSAESCYTDPSKYQVTLAEERTTLARQRNILAVERTFSAWIRTGLALTAVALLMPKLLDLGRWLWVMRIIGIVLLLTATSMYYVAYKRYYIASEKLASQDIATTSRWIITLMIAALVFCTLLSMLLLFQET
jgi:putative membrane protein